MQTFSQIMTTKISHHYLTRHNTTLHFDHSEQLAFAHRMIEEVGNRFGSHSEPFLLHVNDAHSKPGRIKFVCKVDISDYRFSLFASQSMLGREQTLRSSQNLYNGNLEKCAAAFNFADQANSNHRIEIFYLENGKS